MTIPRTTHAFLLALATAATAAAAPFPATAAGATSNACALVTTAEASAAMGVPSLPGKPRTTRRGSSCRYYSADHQKNVFLQTVQADDMLGAQQLGGKAVPGIGNKAVWAAGSLFVQKGASIVQVGLYRTKASMEQMDPQIVPLGKAVAGRM